VNDSLLDVTEGMQPHAELSGIPAQRLDLGAAGQVGDRLVDREGRSVVVLGCDRQVGPANRPPSHTKAVERLRAGDLVHEVQVDVDEVWRTVFALDDEMVVPDLLSQGLRPGRSNGGCSHQCGLSSAQWSDGNALRDE